MRLVVSESASAQPSVYDFKDYPLSGITSSHIGYKWLDLCLEISDEIFETIEIEASLVPGEGGCNGGYIGFWTPTSDMLAKNMPEKSFQYLYNETDNLFVDCKTWTFGKNAKLNLKNNGSEKQIETIHFSVLARPIFIGKNESFKIKFNINVDNKTTNTQEFEFSRGKEIIPSDKVSLMKIEYERFERYDAIKLTGNGNIVHPKQYFTLRGIEYIMENYLPEKEELKLGYVGTDTTENLRSLIRWLITSDLQKRISELVVFYTTEWDQEFVSYLRLEDYIKNQNPSFTVKFHELSEEIINLQRDKKQCNVMISTFVTPWIEGDEKEQYANLIDNCLGIEESYLLSVDPQSVENSVRSELSNQSINNDEIYKLRLKMITAKSTVANENESVEWSIWKKSRGGEY